MEKLKQFAENIDQARIKAFQQKYLDKIRREYEQVLASFGEKVRQEKERKILESLESLSQRLMETEDFEFGQVQKETLKLKLARYLQSNEICDPNTLYDAIVETPKFINADKGSLHRLLEVHEQKTLEKIAQIRKQRAEMTGDEAYNPYEALLRTDSGKYYLARLLNMPHLEEESEYMSHCVGTSDSYVNRMKRGEIEILSLRRTPESKTSEPDAPILTFEYDPKSKTIVQMKKADDNYLKKSDPYFADVVDALKKLRETNTDIGESRDFREISSSELENIKVSDYHILTDEGEIHFKDFDPKKNLFILKIGRMEITQSISKEGAAKIFRIMEDIEVAPEEIAYGPDDINENTRAYIGEWSIEIFKKIRNYPRITHLFESFPDKKICMLTLETDPTVNSPEKAGATMAGKNIYQTKWAEYILQKTEFSKESKKYNLVRFSVSQLGFSNGATTDEIYRRAEELGLELCPAEVGPHLRLQYSGKEWMLIAMKQITVRVGDPYVFDLDWGGEPLELRAGGAGPAERWRSGRRFVFPFRKKT